MAEKHSHALTFQWKLPKHEILQRNLKAEREIYFYSCGRLLTIKSKNKHGDKRKRTKTKHTLCKKYTSRQKKHKMDFLQGNASLASLFINSFILLTAPKHRALRSLECSLWLNEKLKAIEGGKTVSECEDEAKMHRINFSFLFIIVLLPLLLPSPERKVFYWKEIFAHSILHFI